jgi:Carboxypeptidase regulatory-like domain
VGVFALALLVLGGLAGPAAAFAAGSISGVVTDGTDPLAGIEVCASEVSEEEFKCAETGASGEYTLAGLANGNYKVEFWPPESTNYVPQYFNAKPSWGQADQVVVTNGNDTPNVNAVLEEGGWIEGRAIDAVSKAGIEGLEICAFPIDETGFGRCALTDSSGDYEIVGLATDAYEVVFSPKKKRANTSFSSIKAKPASPKPPR